MKPPAKIVTQEGQALSGDRRLRIVDSLHTAGFGSVDEFVAARPGTSMHDLVTELNTDVTYVELMTMWREECAGDDAAMERLAKRTLVGLLRRCVPDGWRSDWDRDAAASEALSRLITRGTAHWPADVGPGYEDGTRRVKTALFEGGRDGTVPEGWLPADEHDPVLAEIFRRHWSA